METDVPMEELIRAMRIDGHGTRTSGLNVFMKARVYSDTILALAPEAGRDELLTIVCALRIAVEQAGVQADTLIEDISWRTIEIDALCKERGPKMHDGTIESVGPLVVDGAPIDENGPSTYAGVERGWKERAEEAEAGLSKADSRRLEWRVSYWRMRGERDDLKSKVSGLEKARAAWKQRAVAWGYHRGKEAKTVQLRVKEAEARVDAAERRVLNAETRLKKAWAHSRETQARLEDTEARVEEMETASRMDHTGMRPPT